MMEPLSKTRRMLYLFIFVLIFFALIPVVVLYSAGYRIGKDYTLEKTGGIFVAGGEAGVKIYVNDVLKKETNSFSLTVYVPDLSVGQYQVKVTKDERYVWTKTFKVLPQKVTEGYPFLLSQKIASTSLSATSTAYKNISLLFASSTRTTIVPSKTATSSTTTLLAAVSKKNIDLVKEGNTISVVWLADMRDVPYYFCGENFIESECVSKHPIITEKGITTYEFYPGRNDLLIFAKGDGIYVTELDSRSPQNTQLLVEGANLDFRVQNGQDVYVRNAKKVIYKLEL